MKVYHCDENLWIWWSQWWYFINGLKLIIAMKIHQLDDNSSTRWKFLTDLIKILQCDENSLKWWKFINLMQMWQCDEKWLIWWKLMDLMKIHWCNEQSSMGQKIKLLWKFIIVIKIYEFDEVNDDISSIWLIQWIWITVMEFIDRNEAHYCNENSSDV